MKILVPFANRCDNTWVSHIVYSLCKTMASQDGVDLKLLPYYYSKELGGDPMLAQPVPGFLHGVLLRFDRNTRLLRRLHTSMCERYLPAQDALYIWPDNPVGLYEAAKDGGKFVAREMINCHLSTVRSILDRESESIGYAIDHGIDDARIADENRTLELADLVFAPSALVRDSLIENGVPAEKISHSSYGWSPSRISTAPRMRPAGATPRICFVGRLSLRKGVHLLLEAFERTQADARLVLCGAVPAEIEATCGAHFADPRVELLGHVRDVSAVLDQADVFVLPSLEEGSPLATYEAMAKGLPVVASPMGGGGVVRDGYDGFIVDPHDSDAFAARLTELIGDHHLRAEMGRRAAERAPHYTWEQVALRRLQAMRDGRGDALPTPDVHPRGDGT